MENILYSGTCEGDESSVLIIYIVLNISQYTKNIRVSLSKKLQTALSYSIN